MLHDANLRKIKENVWKMEKDGHIFSMKQYHSGPTAFKVHRIHEILHSIDFEHVVPVISDEKDLTFIQPWIGGARSVNFKKRSDRTDSLAALEALHQTSQKIDWHASTFLHSYPLLEKWEERIRRFHTIKGLCEAYIGKGQVDEILYYALNGISVVKKNCHDWMNETLLHGDIVHHNLLRDREGYIRFIDFDLACRGPSGIEIALWIHRVLPNIGYDLNFLMEEQPSLKKMDVASRMMLLFPNELLREWLHFFTLSPAGRERQAKKLIPFTEEALSHWPKLWYDVERIKI